MNDPLKEFCLIEELNNAVRLIKAGLGDLQEIDMGNDFYHLPHQSLASGLERLMKCYICLVYEARNGHYPDFKYIKDELGHDLVKIKGIIAKEYYNADNRPRLIEDYEFITNDTELDTIIYILSEFGILARYYNIDIITGNAKVGINPTEKWQNFESSIEDITPYLGEGMQEALYRDYYPRVQRKIIAKIERFLRAICSQFTMGDHGGKLVQYSPIVKEFITRMDSQFGETDYRRTVKILQRKVKVCKKRSESELASSPWPTRMIHRNEFQGEWPFRCEKVIVECRDRICYIINIEGYDFALNGMATTCYNYPDPHDAGLAILGKSVGPFIDIAEELGKIAS